MNFSYARLRLHQRSPPNERKPLDVQLIKQKVGDKWRHLVEFSLLSVSAAICKCRQCFHTSSPEVIKYDYFEVSFPSLFIDSASNSARVESREETRWQKALNVNYYLSWRYSEQWFLNKSRSIHSIACLLARQMCVGKKLSCVLLEKVWRNKKISAIII